jgi:CubicO group peptidase (beta-lactamase class C family)
MSAARAGQLQAALDGWLSELKVAGAVVAVDLPDGTRWVSSSGTNPDTKAAMDATAPFEITSITKTFTASLALKLVGEGKLALDQPIPSLAAVPDFPYAGKLTLRQLLSHTSGLGTYQDTPEYLANKSMTLDPATAVRLSGKVKLDWDPGTNVGYSSSGFLLAGMLEEQAGGASYGDQLKAQFFDPLKLTSTTLRDQKIPGWIGFSTGGLWSTVDDLASWGKALYRDQRVLGADLTGQMLDISNQFSVGLGAWPVCPCSVDPNGTKVITSIGHNGGSASLQYSPSDKVVIAAGLTEPIFDARLTEQDMYDLLARLRAVVDAPG